MFNQLTGRNSCYNLAVHELLRCLSRESVSLYATNQVCRHRDPYEMQINQIFISYSGHDAFEADLLKYSFETLMRDKSVKAWAFQKDQSRSEKDISGSLKQRVKNSKAMVFLISPTTLDSGATQWMELAYADAFEIPTFILLRHLKFEELSTTETGVPPLLLSSQCNPAIQWQKIASDVSALLNGG